ncbi:MAG: hypothetical protein NZ742_08010 [Acidobacteria bacterium]|nr:hypothetical protein [Acidobacteriota bacterium]MDW7984804.1 hypothetical protein [Acidobacteriota bacterium]
MTPAFAQWFVFRTGGGVVKPEDIQLTAWTTVGLYYYPDPHWGVGSDIGFWSQTERRCEFVPFPPTHPQFFCEDVKFQDVTVSLNFIVETQVRQGVRLFAGSGFSSHALEARSDSLRFGFGGHRIGGSEIRIGFQVFAGIDVPLSRRWGLFFSGRYDGVADVAQWKAFGGLRIQFHGGPGRGPRIPLPPPEPEP